MATIVGTKKSIFLVSAALLMLAFSLGCQESHVDKSSERSQVRAQSFFPLTGSVTTTLVATPDGLFTNSRDISFDFYSNAPDATFVCQFGTQDATKCVPPVVLTNLPDGQYSFRVYAISASMGVDLVGVRHPWTVDTVPPSTQLNYTTSGGDQILFVMMGSESSCSFLCSMDGSTPQACVPPMNYQAVPLGPHVFKTWAVDRAGNVDPIGAEHSFQLRSPIATRIVSEVPNKTYANQNSIVFTFEANQPNATFMCTMNGGTATPCSSPFTYTNLSDGAYAFKVQAVDTYGFIDLIGADYSWIVDTTPPTGVVAQVVATSTSITITWNSDEPTTSQINWGRDLDLSRQSVEDTNFTTHHVVRISGLSSNTPFSIQPIGSDRATNPYKLNPVTFKTMR